MIEYIDIELPLVDGKMFLRFRESDITYGYS